MNLFDCEAIHINKIYSVEKFVGSSTLSSTKEYGNFFKTYEIVFYLAGENATIVDGVEIHDCAGSIRYMPKGSHRGNILCSIFPSIPLALTFTLTPILRCRSMR